MTTFRPWTCTRVEEDPLPTLDAMNEAPAIRQYRVVGMDCAKDAAEIEEAVRAVPGVEAVTVSTATHILTLHGS